MAQGNGSGPEGSDAAEVAATAEAAVTVAAPEVGRPAAPAVNWDDSNMRTAYANVVNAASTREEVTLFFGTNQTWNLANPQEYRVSLSERVVLNPYAAKRLWTIMGAVLGEYEKRFGKLDLGAKPKEGGEG